MSQPPLDRLPPYSLTSVQDSEDVSADAPSRGERESSPDAGFPRSARLLKHSDFERVYKQGHRHFSPHMTVFYLARAANDAAKQAAAEQSALESRFLEKGTRVGLTVGRALGGAVQRNRIKRRLREAVRLRRSTVHDAVDIVINPKKSVLTVDFAVVLDEVGRAFEAVAKGLAKAASEPAGPRTANRRRGK